MIPVTRPHLPDIIIYKSYIDKIYKNCQLTNNGPLVRELENKLKNRWDVKNVILVSNGTLALQILYKALEIKKKVVTTAFSFISTASSLSWESIKPVFVDINENNLTLNPRLLLELDDNDIEAVLPVHVYGNPCEVEEIEKIAKEKKWKIIYDAAHAFDVKYNDKSILTQGNASIISFHATKIFHTVEGGAIITQDDALAKKIRSLINFGYENGEVKYLGINAKMSEFHAAMGLSMLQEIDNVVAERKKIISQYLKEIPKHLRSPLNKRYNGSYFPVIFNNEKDLLKVIEKLENNNIYARRYFNPSLNRLHIFQSLKTCNISEKIASKILCLPLYSELKKEEIELIMELIK